MKVVFVTGATATGKSDWALRLAEDSGAVIVNCDSVQVYEGLEIGSGLPTREERSRVPHHLYAYVKPPREMTAGDFRADFFQQLRALSADSRVLVVGGTGFYFQAVEKGMFPAPAVAAEIHERVRVELLADPESAMEELREGDPRTAARLNPSDHYRVARALELLRAGHRPSELQDNFQPEPFPFPLLKTGVSWPREALRERIRRRVAGMIARGLREETRGLLERGLEGWAPLASVGYKETVRALRDGFDDEWLLEEICLRTGQLAKRQETWFKRDRDIQVFSGDVGFASFRESALRFFDRDGTLESP
ncbi:MAG: tRNA (adenosine(37)-N6)-dimethylallyltransferase MiaA [Bdellovibrionaceae bacterium]|nr:tRNA (adenosine(37)-N6)-dimethylallyltransferase MiaA [Pseudobdellovibrionaceae bacterium]